MHRLTKDEVINIILDMLEEGICREDKEEIIWALTRGVSDDELTTNIKSLDASLFSNFYTKTLTENSFLKQK